MSLEDIQVKLDQLLNGIQYKEGPSIFNHKESPNLTKGPNPTKGQQSPTCRRLFSYFFIFLLTVLPPKVFCIFLSLPPPKSLLCGLYYKSFVWTLLPSKSILCGLYHHRKVFCVDFVTSCGV